MEKLSNKKFDQGQIVNDKESQSLFGGTSGQTHIIRGQWAGHIDTWVDTNNNGRPDSGDRLIVHLSAPPPSGPTDWEVEQDDAELAALGIIVEVEP